MPDCSLHMARTKRVLHALDGDQQHIRSASAVSTVNLPFAAADLDAKFPATRHQAAPFAAQRASGVVKSNRLSQASIREGQIYFFFSFAYAFPALSEMLVGWETLVGADTHIGPLEIVNSP